MSTKTQQPAFSQEPLARFTQTTEPWGTRRRHGSISTLCSSQCQLKDWQPPRPPPPALRAIPGGVGGGSKPLEPAASVRNPSSPFLRRESGMSRRFSFGGWLQGGRSSFSGLTLHHYTATQVEEVKLENTYRTAPEQGGHFKAGHIQKLLQATLDSYLEGGCCYSPAGGGHLGQVLTDVLRGKVKEASPPRYKIVCQVVIGQNKNQGVRVASRCLWDLQQDDVAIAAFQNNEVFVLAVVHAVYCE